MDTFWENGPKSGIHFGVNVKVYKFGDFYLIIIFKFLI